MNTDLLNKQLALQQMGGISVKTVLGLLIIAAILLGFFYVLRRYIVPYLGSRKAVKKTAVILYRIEVTIWLIYLVFGLYQLLADSLYISSAILLVVILAGRNIWRDLFAGLAFRLENKFEIGDPVRFDTYNGILREINQRNIRIKTDKEELVTIPFRKLSSAVFIKRQAKGKLHSSQLTLHLGTKSVEEVLPLVDKWLFECPWAIVNENVKSHVIGGGLLQLTVYAVDMESIQKTEDFLQQRIRK